MGEVTVTFLMFKKTFPQGVWEVILFSFGAVLMWIFSIFASIEAHSGTSKKIKERDKRIRELEEEKHSLLSAFKHMTPLDDVAPAYREPISCPVAATTETRPEKERAASGESDAPLDEQLTSERKETETA